MAKKGLDAYPGRLCLFGEHTDWAGKYRSMNADIVPGASIVTGIEQGIYVELEKAGSPNKILNVSPGSIKGTSFNQGKTDLSMTSSLAKEIIANLEQKKDIFIPDYDTVYKKVLNRYHDDFRAEGLHSYDYKLSSGRVVDLSE